MGRQIAAIRESVMARIRTIKPEFFSSKTVGRLPIPARYLLAGMFTEADDEGYLRDDVTLIRTRLLPRDDVTDEAVAEWLAAMIDVGMVQRMEAQERKSGKAVMVLRIVGFREHQVIQRPTRSAYEPTDTLFDAASLMAQRSLNEDSMSNPGGGSEAVRHATELLAPPHEPAPLNEDSMSAHGVVNDGSMTEREHGKGKGSKNLPATQAESDSRRAQRLTKTYTDVVPLSNFPAVMGIVKKAMRAGYADEQITTALHGLARDGRPVTVDTLRIQLEGFTPLSRASRSEAKATEVAGVIQRAHEREAARHAEGALP